MTKSDYIRVSTVLAPYTDFSTINPNVLYYATERGTKVHSLCAAKAQDIWIPSVSEECKGYFDSFVSWFDKQVVKVFHVEKRFYNSVYFYSGQIDLIVKMRTEGIVLVDLKSPVQNYPVWKSQIASYLNLDIPVSINKGATLQLNPNGKTAKMTWCKNPEEAFAQFLHALSAYRFFKGKEKNDD